MSETESSAHTPFHNHVFLGEGHERSERRTWAVIWLCAAMMLTEIVGGWLFGSIALIADGLHMSTHAGALLLAALAYSFARRYANDPRFTFGTGKLSDLAGFTSAIILAMIALLIGYEAVSRLFTPLPIRLAEAIPIAFLGLAINVAGAWLLSGGQHPGRHGGVHGHSHGPQGGAESTRNRGKSSGFRGMGPLGPGFFRHNSQRFSDVARIGSATETAEFFVTTADSQTRADSGHHHDGSKRIATRNGEVVLDLFEDGVPARFRLTRENGPALSASAAHVETVRPDGARQVFSFVHRGGFLESIDEIPEPHAFDVEVTIDCERRRVVFEEHEHARGAAARDNNMRAAAIHVLADAAVSVIVILGLLLARLFGWLWMDPLAGIIGALVIASWSTVLIRDTSAVLLDMNPDRRMADNLRRAIEGEGDRIADLHLWRLGPGHLGAIVSVVTPSDRCEADYRARLARFRSLSHLTIEVRRARREGIAKRHEPSHQPAR
ncbi:MAG TPA: CDF family Co(II)/Ni(II) efflux transporter DmeF [Roseiarcus sp.]|jgi:cation diffusion facilitator family transporter|nr:CDF family Co(II)/Ni(II) efflux transporter DmeF [Roseiarcus sp.]